MATIPKTISAEERPEARSGEAREVAARCIAGRAETGDEQRGRTAGLPYRLRVRRGVVRDGRRRCEPDEGAEAEEEADRELLGTRGDDVEAEQEAEAREVQDEAPAVGQVAPEVGAEREEARRDRHEPHRLAEERTRLVACDGGLKGCIDGAHEPKPLSRAAPFPSQYGARNSLSAVSISVTLLLPVGAQQHVSLSSSELTEEVRVRVSARRNAA